MITKRLWFSTLKEKTETVNQFFWGGMGGVWGGGGGAERESLLYGFRDCMLVVLGLKG